eukprot:snap_masked-scaffold_1-processed-gene-29.29-mRNA-1 protein AED:1.00 eAED:1.00 QI:0/-1/0/0/-1/1/1/0/84
MKNFEKDLEDRSHRRHLDAIRRRRRGRKKQRKNSQHEPGNKENYDPFIAEKLVNNCRVDELPTKEKNGVRIPVFTPRLYFETIL